MENSGKTLQGEAGLILRKKKGGISAKAGSGNVFLHLGFPNRERELVKARLTLQIYRLIKARGLTQTQAGDILV
jgi:hypothetical protein